MKLRVVALILTGAMFVAIRGFAADNLQKPQDLFQAAGEFYREENYQEAIAQYGKLISQGHESNYIYFNLANAYYKAGQLGRARLNYLRALKISPRDPDIIYNFQYITKELGVSSYQRRGNVFKRLINAHINFYSFNEMVVIIAFLLGLLFVLEIASKAYSWKGRGRVGMLSLLLILVVIFIAGFAVKKGHYARLAVAVDSGAAHFEPKEDSTVHFQVDEGEEIKIIKQDKSWVKIRRFDGKLGWVAKKSIEAI